MKAAIIVIISGVMIIMAGKYAYDQEQQAFLDCTKDYSDNTCYNQMLGG